MTFDTVIQDGTIMGASDMRGRGGPGIKETALMRADEVGVHT